MVGLLKSAGFARVTSADSVVVPAEHIEDLGLILVVGPEVDLLCSQAREIPVLTNTPILAMVPAIPAGAGRGAIAAGANDVIYENPSAAVLGARVRNLASGIASRRRARELIAVQRTMMEVQATIAEGGDSPEALRSALVRAAATLEFDRASLIAHIEGSFNAYVIAATDDPTLSQFTLTMAKYPEVTAALEGGIPLFIDDAQHHPVTANVAGKVREKGIRGMAVFPVVWRKRSLGVVLFRRARRGADHIGERGRDFGLMFANQIALSG